MRSSAMRLAIVGLAAAAIGAGGAQAAEIKVLCSNGLREVLSELRPDFEKASGHKLVVTFGLAAAFMPRNQPTFLLTPHL